jgi:hypothetical protein
MRVGACVFVVVPLALMMLGGGERGVRDTSLRDC